MRVLNGVFGILSIITAGYCILYPGITFLESGWIISVLLGAWGICTIIDFVKSRRKEDGDKNEAAMGIVGLILGIAAAVLSILELFMPGIRAILDISILCIFAGWMIIGGIDSVIISSRAKKAGSKTWMLTLIWGILVVIAGIYGYFHLIFVAQTIGFLIGILLMVYGFRLVFSVFEKGN